MSEDCHKSGGVMQTEDAPEDPCKMTDAQYEEYIYGPNRVPWPTTHPTGGHPMTPPTVEDLAKYIESESECLMGIVLGETKHNYGVRLLKVMADELRDKFGRDTPIESAAVSEDKPTFAPCGRCGQPLNNGWKHNHESGYGDFATISCSAPNPESPTPPEATQ